MKADFVKEQFQEVQKKVVNPSATINPDNKNKPGYIRHMKEMQELSDEANARINELMKIMPLAYDSENVTVLENGIIKEKAASICLATDFRSHLNGIHFIYRAYIKRDNMLQPVAFSGVKQDQIDGGITALRAKEQWLIHTKNKMVMMWGAKGDLDALDICLLHPPFIQFTLLIFVFYFRLDISHSTGLPTEIYW